jgi:GT2 family glycosyltransferase
VKASVVICAFSESRWEVLTEALRSVAAQSLPATETILVVDHNDRLLARARASFPGVTVLENTGSRGLSEARNTGVRAAAGDVVAFLDDDAVAAPDWLSELTAAFRLADVVGAGGLVEPRWSRSKKPAWLPEEFYWTLGCSYRGLPADGAAIRNPIGASMAFRRDALLRAGGFRDGIGRRGTVPLGCEETELSIRVAQQEPSARIVYQRRARAAHWVDASRTTWRYFVARCWAEGLSKAAVTSHVGRVEALSSERRYVVRTLPSALARGLADTWRGELAGLARSAAILLGLAATAAGYGAGRLADVVASPANNGVKP